MVFAERYTKICKSLGWVPRRHIVRVLDTLNEIRRDYYKSPIIVKLPTGYGKTAITLTLSTLAIDGKTDDWIRVIHVLPMRSIVNDIASNLNSWLKKLGYKIEVAKQHMGSRMSPFFSKKGAVVTTLDTFVLNLYKAPAIEISKLVKLGYAHYELSRANIYSAAVLLDEFHLFVDVGFEKRSNGLYNREIKSLASTLAAVHALCKAGVPTILCTATLPSKILKLVKYTLRDSKLNDQCIISYDSPDDIFESERKAKILHLQVIDEKDWIKYIKNPKHKVLLVFNKVSRAVKAYYELRDAGLKPLLLHGRLLEGEKEKRIKELDKSNLVVATQVVEAGIDKSFDVLITDPCPIDRLVQRIGRIARKKDSKSGEIYIIDVKEEAYSGVYNKELTEKSIYFVKHKLDGISIGKLDLEMLMLDGIEGVYNKIVSESNLRNEIRKRIKVLRDLDEQPLLTKTDARRMLERFRGITDSFGLVSVFDSKRVLENVKNIYEFSVGVSENRALSILRDERLVVKIINGKPLIKEINPEKILEEVKEKPLSLILLESGIEGLATKRIDDEVGLI